MSWRNQNMEAKSSRGGCKIRKRGCSSSSSSSLVQKYRVKRAILVGKKAGSTTPVPTWKTAAKSNALALSRPELLNPSPTPPHITNTSESKEVSVSARKLAATLWEINQIPSPIPKPETKTRAKKLAKISPILPPNLSDPSSSPIHERMDRSRGHSRYRRTSVVSRKLQVSDCKLGGLDSMSNGTVMEVETQSKRRIQSKGEIRTNNCLKELSNGLTTSKELLKVLSRVWGLEEQRSSSIPLVSALRVEVDRARLLADQLILEQMSNMNETECLLKYFAEEKAAWKRRERDRIRDAIACIAEELEVEKKLRRQTERLNKKLGKELADTKASLLKATKELEGEKRAKEILEQVCDELARGIGEDRAEAEQLKKESAKVREEVEKEREMLQLADVLREERVQMKLSEAKYHFEEKNAAVEKLRNELESCLRSKIVKEDNDESRSLERIKELQAYLKSANFGLCPAPEKDQDKGEVANVEDGDGDDSADSDLHSIELNMDNNSRSYKWSYACKDENQVDSKKLSVASETKERRSFSDKIQWGSICFDRGSSNRMDCFLGSKTQEDSDISDAEKSPDLISESQNKDYGDEIKRYKSLKSLREHILSSAKIAPIGSFASPTRQWEQALPLQDLGNIAREDSPELQRETSKHRQTGTRSERRTSTSSRQ